MAAILAIGGPLVTGDAFSQWISRALIFLVIITSMRTSDISASELLLEASGSFAKQVFS